MHTDNASAANTGAQVQIVDAATHAGLAAAYAALTGCTLAEGLRLVDRRGSDVVDALDGATQLHTAHGTFLGLVRAHGGYRPTLTCTPAVVRLANAYDAYQVAVNDPRRAERRPAPGVVGGTYEFATAAKASDCAYHAEIAYAAKGDGRVQVNHRVVDLSLVDDEIAALIKTYGGQRA